MTPLLSLTAHIGELGFSYELLFGDNASEDATPRVVDSYRDFSSVGSDE